SGGDASTTAGDGGARGDGALVGDGQSTDGATTGDSGPPTDPDAGPPAGNPDGHCVVPPEAQAESVATPTTVVGTGTPASCTSDAFVAAVAKGGVVTFDCG